MSTEHEGLRAAYRKCRDFYYQNKNRTEVRKKLAKEASDIRRLNKLLDLGAKI